MQTKKIKLIALLIAIVVAAIGLTVWLVFFTPSNANYKDITLVLLDNNNALLKQITMRTKCVSLGELLEEQNEQLDITYITGANGKYITDMYGQVTASQYVCVLSNDATYADTSSYSVEITYNDITYISSTVGVDLLALADGKCYALVIVNL